MRFPTVAILPLVLTLATTAPLRAELCETALTRDILKDTSHYQTKASWLATMTDEEYNTFKNDSSSGVDLSWLSSSGFVDFGHSKSADEVREAARLKAKKENWTIDQDIRKNVDIDKLSPDAARNYAVCLFYDAQRRADDNAISVKLRGIDLQNEDSQRALLKAVDDNRHQEAMRKAVLAAEIERLRIDKNQHYFNAVVKDVDFRHKVVTLIISFNFPSSKPTAQHAIFVRGSDGATTNVKILTRSSQILQVPVSLAKDAVSGRVVVWSRETGDSVPLEIGLRGHLDIYQHVCAGSSQACPSGQAGYGKVFVCHVGDYLSAQGTLPPHTYVTGGSVISDDRINWKGKTDVNLALTVLPHISISGKDQPKTPDAADKAPARDNFKLCGSSGTDEDWSGDVKIRLYYAYPGAE